MGKLAMFHFNLLIRIFSIFVLFISFDANAQKENFYSAENDSLRQVLLKMKEADQNLRKKVDSVRVFFGEPSFEMTKLWNDIDSLDSANTKYLKEIVRKYGWPGISMVGTDGSKAAFLILLHADKDSTIQEEFLPLIEEVAKNYEIDLQSVAYLTDRILIYKKDEMQVYGTQLKYNTREAKWEPFPIKDEKSVDIRRREMGMMDLNDYLNLMNN
jgi:hypothetical protein